MNQGAHSAICQCPDCELRRKVEAYAEIKILRQSWAPTAIIYQNGDRPRALPLRDWNRPLRVDDDVDKLEGEAKRLSKLGRSLRTLRRGGHWTPPRYWLTKSECELRANYHKYVRLLANRLAATATKGKARIIVFELCREAVANGATRRGCRREVKRLAAARGIPIPGEWQLGKLIRDFFT